MYGFVHGPGRAPDDGADRLPGVPPRPVPQPSDAAVDVSAEQIARAQRLPPWGDPITWILASADGISVADEARVVRAPARSP
jgi:hypothetical protein